MALVEAFPPLGEQTSNGRSADVASSRAERERERYRAVWSAAYERALAKGFSTELARFRAAEAVREARAAHLGITL